MTTEIRQELEICVLGNVSKKIEIPSRLRILDPSDDASALSWFPDMCVIRIINQKDGDKRIVWDGGSFDEIRDAKELFDNLIEEGMIPYCVDPNGKKSPEVMTEFDPGAEEVVMSEDKRPKKREIVMAPQKMLAGG